MRVLQSEDELAELKQEHDVLLVYFTTSSCNVGESLLPKVEALLAREELPGVLVNTTDLPAVGGQHLVLTVPVVAIFLFGREYERFSRHIVLAHVEEALYRATEISRESGTSRSG